MRNAVAAPHASVKYVWLTSEDREIEYNAVTIVDRFLK